MLFPFLTPKHNPTAGNTKHKLFWSEVIFYSALTIEVSDVFGRVLSGEKVSCHSLECLFHPNA